MYLGAVEGFELQLPHFLKEKNFDLSGIVRENLGRHDKFG
jgi:hypothetical protein